MVVAEKVTEETRVMTEVQKGVVVDGLPVTERLDGTRPAPRRAADGDGAEAGGWRGCIKTWIINRLKIIILR